MLLTEASLTSDFIFDRAFSFEARELSGTHWTPIGVAMRAAHLLVDSPQARILDVGSGVGKFCFVGALRTPGHFTGVEQRQELLDEAQTLLRDSKIEHVAFLHSDAVHIDWSEYTGLYFFNPLENLSGYLYF